MKKLKVEPPKKKYFNTDFTLTDKEFRAARRRVCRGVNLPGINYKKKEVIK